MKTIICGENHVGADLCHFFFHHFVSNLIRHVMKLGNSATLGVQSHWILQNSPGNVYNFPAKC